MDEAQKKMMFILGFMMLFQLVDHIYNSHVQDMNSIMNASIAMEIAKFLFSIVALHENNLTTPMQICLKNWGIR
jgi:hypothetical protein